MIAYVKTIRGARTIAIYDMVEDRYFELWENSGSPYEKIADSFAWSPDSQRICLRGRRSTEETRQREESLPEIATVLIHDSSKLKIQELCEDGFSPAIAWHPDGERIVFSKLPDDEKLTQLYWFNPGADFTPGADFKPGADEESRPFPGQDSTRENSSACWTRDGSRLIFVSTVPDKSEEKAMPKPTETTANTDD